MANRIVIACYLIVVCQLVDGLFDSSLTLKLLFLLALLLFLADITFKFLRYFSKHEIFIKTIDTIHKELSMGSVRQEKLKMAGDLW